MTFDLQLINMWSLHIPSYQPTNSLSILGLFLYCVLLCWAKPKGDVCVLNGLQYRVGETWHPQVSPVAENCVNCSCLEGGEVKCTSVACEKPNCEDPKYVPGECCPICEVGEVDVSPESSPVPGCDHDGNYFEDGELFPSNKTAFKPLHNNQCVLCGCFKGEVFCHLKTCLPQPDCLKTVVVSDDCCQHCEEYAEEDKIGISKEVTSLDPGDCMSTMGPQKNGSTWKPVIGQYGEMECVVCKCHNGHVDCNRIECPAEKCKQPQLRKGNCCRECPKGRERRGKKKKDGKKKKKKNSKNCKKGKDSQKRKKKGKKRKRCKSKKKGKKKNSKSTNKNKEVKGKSAVPSTTKMSAAKQKLCVNKKADYLVYFLKEDNSYSLVLDVVIGDSMEKINWTIHKGRIASSKRGIVPQPNSLRKQIEIKDLLGSTTKRNIKKFFKRLERKQQRCKKKCRRKLLEKSIKKLKVKKINLNKTC